MLENKDCNGMIILAARHSYLQEILLYVAEASTMLWALQLAVTNFSTISLKGMQRCIDACNGKLDECSWICLQSDMMSNFLYCVLLVLFLTGFEGK